MNALKNLLVMLLTLVVLGTTAAIIWFGGAYVARTVSAFDWTSSEAPVLLSVSVGLSGVQQWGHSGVHLTF